MAAVAVVSRKRPREEDLAELCDALLHKTNRDVDVALAVLEKLQGEVRKQCQPDWLSLPPEIWTMIASKCPVLVRRLLRLTCRALSAAVDCDFTGCCVRPFHLHRLIIVKPTLSFFNLRTLNVTHFNRARSLSLPELLQSPHLPALQYLSLPTFIFPGPDEHYFIGLPNINGRHAIFDRLRPLKEFRFQLPPPSHSTTTINEALSRLMRCPIDRVVFDAVHQQTNAGAHVDDTQFRQAVKDVCAASLFRRYVAEGGVARVALLMHFSPSESHRRSLYIWPSRVTMFGAFDELFIINESCRHDKLVSRCHYCAKYQRYLFSILAPRIYLSSRHGLEWWVDSALQPETTPPMFPPLIRTRLYCANTLERLSYVCGQVHSRFERPGNDTAPDLLQSRLVFMQQQASHFHEYSQGTVRVTPVQSVNAHGTHPYTFPLSLPILYGDD
jgi:hypothetical protein